MKVIVTGGAGFIGSNLVRLLLERGHEVLNIDALTYAGNIHSLDGLADSPAYRFLHADVRDSSLMSRTLREYGPDWVMHLAAESHVDRSIDDPGNFMTTNVMGTFSLLQAALEYYRSLEGEKKERFRFHHISTDDVYGSFEFYFCAFRCLQQSFYGDVFFFLYACHKFHVLFSSLSRLSRIAFSNKKVPEQFFNYCSGTGYFMFPRYHPHCVFLSGFPGENAHSFILNAYHGSAYLISCSDLMFSRPAPECSPLYVSSMLMLSVGDICFLSDSAYGVSFTAFFILCIIAQQFCICKHLIFTDFI